MVVRAADVRKQLRELLGKVVLPGLGPSALQPFLPLLMAHTCSAMTHLSQDVRWGSRRVPRA